jgi:ABC-type branched-subunit amino acid transport system permease subunit
VQRRSRIKDSAIQAATSALTVMNNLVRLQLCELLSTFGKGEEVFAVRERSKVQHALGLNPPHAKLNAMIEQTATKDMPRIGMPRVALLIQNP